MGIVKFRTKKGKLVKFRAKNWNELTTKEKRKILRYSR